MKRVVIVLVFLLSLISFHTAKASVDPLSVSISFDKTSYEVNSDVTVTYALSGGSNSYNNIFYICYSKDNGNLVSIKSGQLLDAIGTIVYTPTIGQETYIHMDFYDSNNRFCSKNSESMALTGGSVVDPLSVSISFDKTSYEIKSDVTVTYALSGGSNSYNNIFYICYSKDNGNLVPIKSGQLLDAIGTIVYTPTIGQETYIHMDFYDSDNRFCSKNSESMALTGGSVVDPLSVSISFDKTSYEVNSDVTVTYALSGGSNSYNNIFYICYSKDNGNLVSIKSGQLLDAIGTIVYTPTIGQETYIHMDFYDSDNRFCSKNSESMALTDELSYVFLPADLKMIEEEAFAGAAFEAVIIPDGCTTIAPRAFADCPNLVYVRIPASVTSIAEDAFEGCEQVVMDRAE